MLESVTQKGVKVVTGRYLFDWAKKGLVGIRKSLPFLVLIKIRSRKALRVEEEKPMKKPLIANDFQIVGSIISRKLA